MDSEKIKKLENSSKLKKKIFSKNVWKTYAIVPPAIVMFAGILGVVYLLNIDKLISLYAIPFAIIFGLGTIWLKSVRRYILNKRISENKEFLVCLAINFAKENKKTILLFSTGKNRNNKYYLEKEKKDLENNDAPDLSAISTTPMPIDNSDIHLVQLPLSKKFSGNADNDYWIVYTGNNSVEFLTQMELTKYT